MPTRYPPHLQLVHTFLQALPLHAVRVEAEDRGERQPLDDLCQEVAEGDLQQSAPLLAEEGLRRRHKRGGGAAQGMAAWRLSSCRHHGS